MDFKAEPLIQSARLFYQKGDFLTSLVKAQEAYQVAEAAADLSSVIQAIRLIFQCSQELEQLSKIEAFYQKIQDIYSSETDSQFKARSADILGMWLLTKGQMAESKKMFAESLHLSTELQDFEGIARCLHAHAFLYAIEQNHLSALSYLDKALYLTAQRSFKEIEVACLILKGYVVGEIQGPINGIEITWQAYEQARLYGFHNLMGAVMVQIAVLYRDAGNSQMSALYYELAMRGLDLKNFVRLNKMIESRFAEGKKDFSASDLTVNEDQHNVLVRDRGAVDFKNQHTLFDMVRLFSMSPGVRFSKEELIERIWNQAYDCTVHDNLLYVSIRRLRKLLELNPDSPQFVLRDRKGYYMPSHINVKIQKESLL